MYMHTVYRTERLNEQAYDAARSTGNVYIAGKANWARTCSASPSLPTPCQSLWQPTSYQDAQQLAASAAGGGRSGGGRGRQNVVSKVLPALNSSLTLKAEHTELSSLRQPSRENVPACPPAAAARKSRVEIEVEEAEEIGEDGGDGVLILEDDGESEEYEDNRQLF